MTIKTQTNQYMTSYLNSRMKQKMMIIIHAVHAKIHFQNILRYFLDNADTETMDKFGLLRIKMLNIFCTSLMAIYYLMD